MSSEWSKRQAGVGLIGFNATDIWSAPGDPINSTAAFHHATHLEAQAYIANRWLFTAIMIMLLVFILLQVPHTYLRLKASPSLWYNVRLLRPTPAEIAERKQADYSAPPHRTLGLLSGPPRRLRHIQWPIPIYHVRGFDLPLSEFLAVFVIWASGLGVAGWCQASFLTDASRSTLVVMFFMTFTAGLGIKAGGIGTWLAYGYTAVNFLHRWTGRLVLLLSTLHVIAYLVVFYKDGIAKVEMAKPANYLGAIAFAGLCLMGIVSVGFIRDRWWLVFKFGHHFGMLLVLAGLNYHSGDVVPYLLAIWGLIIINTIFRYITTRFTTATLIVLPGADSTLVTFPSFTRGFTPGQHLRIRIFSGLGLGLKTACESHPFTIASADGSGNGVQCVIKRAGDWTEGLYALASRHDSGQTIRCSVEGPYGGPINFIFPAFSSVLVVVGGSGVSFGLGVIRGLISDMYHGRALCKHLTLVWTVRHQNHLEALVPIFEAMLSSASNLESVQPDFHLDLILCSTAPVDPLARNVEKKSAGSELDRLSRLETPATRVRVLNRRPDVSGILTEVLRNTLGGGVGVGVCGPGMLVEGMQRFVHALPLTERNRSSGKYGTTLDLVCIETNIHPRPE
ncbi:MAG: hypothetical protein TREMPRED_005719 [Tremellales sp. Tagirdzhanova-0007]|nr:MAG: hypothetical protein TREMPRED_005719 [Tremellales sp. Tagirdzhanova-0007]